MSHIHRVFLIFQPVKYVSSKDNFPKQESILKLFESYSINDRKVIFKILLVNAAIVELNCGNCFH